MNHSTLTERGQVSIPAALRKAMHLRAGQRLAWEQISERECRIVVTETNGTTGPLSVLGYGRTLHPPRRTSDWMTELREAENPSNA